MTAAPQQYQRLRRESAVMWHDCHPYARAAWRSRQTEGRGEKSVGSARASLPPSRCPRFWFCGCVDFFSTDWGDVTARMAGDILWIWAAGAGLCMLGLWWHDRRDWAICVVIALVWPVVVLAVGVLTLALLVQGPERE